MSQCGIFLQIYKNIQLTSTSSHKKAFPPTRAMSMWAGTYLSNSDWCLMAFHAEARHRQVSQWAYFLSTSGSIITSKWLPWASTFFTKAEILAGVIDFTASA